MLVLKASTNCGIGEQYLHPLHHQNQHRSYFLMFSSITGLVRREELVRRGELELTVILFDAFSAVRTLDCPLKLASRVWIAEMREGTFAFGRLSGPRYQLLYIDPVPPDLPPIVASNARFTPKVPSCFLKDTRFCI